MSDGNEPGKGFKIVHWGALTLLFVMMVQPSIDNVMAIVSGTWSMGGQSLEVTFGNAIGHVVAMTLGWVALWLYFKRRKIGAYLTIVAHGLGFAAAYFFMADLLFAMMTPAIIGGFFVIMTIVTLGPIFLYKDQYS